MRGFLVLFLVLFSHLFSACAPPRFNLDSEIIALEGSTPTTLVGARGTWLVPCQTSSANPFFQSNQVKVSSYGSEAGSVVKQTFFYSDSACGGELLAVSTETYVNYQESTTNDSATMQVSQIEITPKTLGARDALNLADAGAGACGVTHWILGAPHDVLGKNCTAAGLDDYSLLTAGATVPYDDQDFTGAEKISDDPLP